MSWWNNLFGTTNPAQGAMPYLDQIAGQTNQYNQPYFEAGKNALPTLEEQYQNILSNPGGAVNKIGESYHESPGFKFALQNALQASGHAAAAGGMAGTPAHQFDAASMATGLANQDYNNYLQNALGLYGQGLTGEQGMAQMGQTSGNNMANMVAQQLASQAGYNYAGGAAKNQAMNNLWGNAFGALGTLGAFNPWHMFGDI